MKINALRYVKSISLTVGLSLVWTSVAWSQNKSNGGQAQVQAKSNLEQARLIEQSTDTGIFVDAPKVYDDSSLQLMLNAARARLAALQSFDQTGLLQRIGAITGATLQQQSIAAQVLGPPLPSTAVTSLGATGSTQVVSNTGGPTVTTTAPTGTTVAVTNNTGQTTTTASGQPAQNVTTTTPQMTASAPTPPPNTAALPSSGFSVSSLDALNEMMQLTSEIANLQLLLEGSLTDRFVKGQRIIKPRTTLGFPINLTAQKAYKDAVAVVEVEAINPPSGTFSDEPPTVTALLPREKTYNVAAITDRMTSIGGGLVTQVIGGGFSFLRGRKSYYIVQDQDTLATVHRNPTPTSTLFSWQFRPVLGQHFIRSGLKQTFVQLANPIPTTVGCFGKVKIRTYWRKYDRKHGILKEVIADSIRSYDFQPIPVFDLAPVVQALDMKDLGAGMVQASVGGRFLSGTYVRVGGSYYGEGSPGFTHQLTQIRFVAPAADIAKYKAYIVSRDGTETEIVDPRDPERRLPLPSPCDEGVQSPSGFQAAVADRSESIGLGGEARFIMAVNSSDNVNRSYTFKAVGALPLPEIKTKWDEDITTGANVHVDRTLSVRASKSAVPGIYIIKLSVETSDNQRLEFPVTLTVKAPQPQLSVTVAAYDNSNSVLTATVTNLPSEPVIEDYVIVVGGRVFGLSDAPIERTSVTPDQAVLQVVLPNSLLLGATKVEVKPLLWRDNHAVSAPVGNFRADGSSERIVLLDQDTAGGKFLLYGNRLTHAEIRIPNGVMWKTFYNINESDTLRMFELTAEQLKKFKQIVIQKGRGERPIILPLPPLVPDPKPALTVKGGATVVTSTGEIIVQGELDGLTTVHFGNTEIKPDFSKDKKSVTLAGLVGAGVTKKPGEKELVFEFEGGKKVTLKIDVVNSRIEIVERK